jgi:hypothetical protein
MTKHYKVTVAFFALFLSAFFSASAATTAEPKVVFIGDWITAGWDLSAHPNWINKGITTDSYGGVFEDGPGSSYSALSSFQSDVVSLHPDIVHIMVGTVDANVVYDSYYTYYIPSFLNNLDQMVKEARAANIKVVLGMGAQNFEFSGNVEPINAVIAAYGAAHNIPVINYGDALCGCTGSIAPGGIGYTNWVGSGAGPGSIPPQPYLTTAIPLDTPSVPTAAGYAVMTQMATGALDTMNLAIKSGYLQNVEADNENGGAYGYAPNVNSVGSNQVVQFTPQALYSDGVVRPILNSSFAGSSGTWTSSNPLVMYVNQKGLAWSLTGGTAAITYTSPNGVRFNKWVMYVEAPLE